MSEMCISKNVATRKGEREGGGEREREGVIEVTFRTRKIYPIERERL